MRCKQGDMAYDLGLNPRHFGRTCTVGEYRGPCRVIDGRELPNAWQITFSDDKPGEEWVEDDSRLLPIRPGELEETENKEALCQK